MIRHVFRDRLGRRSNASVEFAIFVPLLLIIFMGTAEMATAYRTSQKLNAMVANVASAVSLSQAVSAAAAPVQNTTATTPYYTSFTSSPQTVQNVSLPDLCYGATLGVQPFPAENMTLDIASITEETVGNTPDEWEYDQTVNGGTCVGNSGTTILGSNAAAIAENNLINVRCDNVIIVQASLPYPGLFGLFLKSALNLKQTAYTRWAYAEAKTELMCAGCTAPTGGGTTSLQPNPPNQICDSNNALPN